MVLYALNPVVLYFVTFPYYYFFQAIPSFALIFLLLTRDRWIGPERPTLLSGYVALSVMLAFVLLTRSTTIVAIAAFFVLAALWVPDRRVMALGVVLFAGVVATGHSPSQKNFWHTAYIGVGGYPNPHVSGLSDNNGYALFERKTGVPLDASLGGNYYQAPVMAQYKEVAQDEFLLILRGEWPRLTLNAVLNVLQGFTIGYLVGQPHWVHLGMAAVGLAVLGLFLATGQFLVAALVVTTSLTFTLYYPPIPAYMYGAYALLALGVIRTCDRLLPSKLKASK
jgi:hypothetical protein